MTKSFYTNIKQYGNNLLYIGYENGKRVEKQISFEPTIWLKNKTPTGYKSIYGDDLVAKKFDGIKDAKDFIKKYKDVENFDLYGTDRFPVLYIAENFDREIQYDFSNIRIFYIDIENFSDNGAFPDPDYANGAITVITIHDSKTKTNYVFLVDKEQTFVNNHKDVVLYRYDTEKEMLAGMLSFWAANCPDIVTGWNSRAYDIKYIINRCNKVLGESVTQALSPWGIIRQSEKNVFRYGKYEKEKAFDIYGVSELDYMDLYKKYTYTKQESYSLDFIAETELDENKLEYDGSLDDLYYNDRQKYVDYNIHDVNLVVRLDEKLKFLELVVDMSYFGHVPIYNDTLGSVKYWEYLIFNHLYHKNIIERFKLIDGDDKETQYKGAVVLEPVPGKYNWIVSLDLTSLYPSIIRQVNIGPDTLVETQSNFYSVDELLLKTPSLDFLKEHDLSMSANCKFYRKDKQSFLSELMEILFIKRKEYKKKMIEYKKEYEATGNIEAKKLADVYNIKQMAAKICLNSAYGATGNAFFTHFSIDNAEAITVTGQLVIQWIKNKINAYLNSLLKTTNIEFVIAGDTDSVYITLDKLVTSLNTKDMDTTKIINFIDNFVKNKLEPYIDQSYTELAEYMNHKQHLMIMKREAISDVGVFVAKKKYFLRVYDNEGVRYHEPELKIAGIEVVRSSTPKICRAALKEALNIIIFGTESDLKSHVSTFKQYFYTQPAHIIGIPSTANDVAKYTITPEKIPMHINGSIAHNKLKDKMNIIRLKHIQDGDKIKYVKLTLPNTAGCDVISFIETLPPEFGLEKYINYNDQFIRVFESPLKKITDVIGWRTDGQVTFA